MRPGLLGHSDSRALQVLAGRGCGPRPAALLRSGLHSILQIRFVLTRRS